MLTTEYGGLGECLAAGDGTAGYARAVAPRWLKNPLLSRAEGLEPWASQALAAAGQHGETIILRMDQTDLGDRFAMLMLRLGVGDRALPLAWTVEAGPANLGVEAQKLLLERAWFPAGRRGCYRPIASIPPGNCSAGSTHNPADIIGYGCKGI